MTFATLAGVAAAVSCSDPPLPPKKKGGQIRLKVAFRRLGHSVLTDGSRPRQVLSIGARGLVRDHVVSEGASPSAHSQASTVAVGHQLCTSSNR